MKVLVIGGGIGAWPQRLLVEARAPHGFDDLDAVASLAEREAIVRGFASMAGYSREQVNRRDGE
ncbi:MAG TPA: hypothetical protein VE111_12380 [Bradyrhizobium sp.]|nr:hypothetical protein [Bradyrhizobium sp.]